MRSRSPAEFIDDPNWASFLPETPEASRVRRLPSHEDCSRLDPAAVAAHLVRGGTLGSMEGYEERPGQIDMLKAVVRAFNDREHLMIEAGTGVGKSLAYLLPSVMWAWTNDTPVVVSTATRNLQSQLVTSDIPRAVSILGDDAGKFRVALLKGRANYLCLKAVGDFFAAGFWTMSRAEQEEMPHFIEWLESTEDGDLDSYGGLPRSLISCPGEECGGRSCPYYSRCFVYRARRNAADAHLVVVNHALVLADAVNPGGGILPAYARLVLDEAHNLEGIATDYLRSEFSVANAARMMNRLSRRSRSRKGRSSGGVVAAIARQLQRGALAACAAGDKVRWLVSEIPSRIARAMDAIDELSDVAAGLLKPRGGSDAVRYRVVVNDFGCRERQHSLHGLFKPYSPEDWDESRLSRVHARFETALAALVDTLHDIRDVLKTAVEDGDAVGCADVVVQVESIAESVVEFANETNFVIRGDKENFAYWVDRVHQDGREAYLRLVGAPLSVADALKAMLYDVKDSVVLSSATLRVGSSFTYMSKRLGCEDRFRALTAESPFDYLRQSLVLAPDCLPDPSAGSSGYAAALASLMTDLFSATRGRALALFTSYEMMSAVAAAARVPLAERGMTLLVQGEDISRESMTARLRGAGRGGDAGVVLFGAQSFWEGVDVSGDALSCVVIARLPFAQVGDPMVEARAEKIDREGGSSFREYMLPEAVIKFRQGFGRLIRSRRDRGVVVVADPRIVTKNYGAVFRKSIPAPVKTVVDADELLRQVNAFFEE